MSNKKGSKNSEKPIKSKTAKVAIRKSDAASSSELSSGKRLTSAQLKKKKLDDERQFVKDSAVDDLDYLIKRNKKKSSIAGHQKSDDEDAEESESKSDEDSEETEDESEVEERSSKRQKVGKAERIDLVESKLVKIESQNNQIIGILETLKSIVEKKESNKEIERVKVKLYNGGDILVDTERMGDALNASTGCAFAARILTNVFCVSELYRCSWSGQNPRFKSENTIKKIGLDKKKKNDLILAASKRFPNDAKCNSITVSRAIGNKLDKLQNLFNQMKNNENLNLKRAGLSEMDLIYFEEFEKFNEDSTLFDDLDTSIDGTTEESPTEESLTEEP